MAKSSLKLIAAVAVGLAAGIGIGILVAPAKGSKTRKRLKKKFMELADTVEEGVTGKLEELKAALSPDEEKPGPKNNNA
jgi:gas vesicle protein